MTQAATKSRLDAEHHFRGCPSPPERVEVYETESPEGEVFRVTRCGECGGAHYEKKERSDG